jgi:hypothetical protein
MFDIINFKIILFSALLFFLGYALAPTAYYKNIGWLLAYPMWIVKKMDLLSKKTWKPITLFAFLFSMNSLSLFIDLASAVVPLLPFVFAIWTGMNIGVVTYHTLNGEFYYTALMNPVAIFELPAAFLTFSMAIQYNLAAMGITSVLGITWKGAGFERYLILFLVAVLPILLMAGIIETYLIHTAKKLEENDDEES